MTVFRRQWILTIRNRAFARAQVAQALIQGLLIGTVFFKLSSTDYITRYGFCFTTMMALSLAAMAQIPQIIKERNVYYKQRSANFFRTQTYVWASVLSQLPFSLITTTLMSVLVYFMTNMQNTFEAYIFFWCILFFLSMGMGMLFKFFAAAMPDTTSAQGLASCSVLILVLMSGYIIQQDEIQSYFKWLYYISPLQYGYSALMINEFMSGRYDEKIPASLSQGEVQTYVVFEHKAREHLFLSIHLHLFLSIHLLRVLINTQTQVRRSISPSISNAHVQFLQDVQSDVLRGTVRCEFFRYVGCISLFRLLEKWW